MIAVRYSDDRIEEIVGPLEGSMRARLRAAWKEGKQVRLEDQILGGIPRHRPTAAERKYAERVRLAVWKHDREFEALQARRAAGWEGTEMVREPAGSRGPVFPWDEIFGLDRPPLQASKLARRIARRRFFSRR